MTTTHPATSALPVRARAQAVVLAAGVARRMWPLSAVGHKGLLEVGGRTLIGRLVDQLHLAGAGDVTIVVGHRADEIRAHLAEHGAAVPVRFLDNPRFAETNNVVSLLLSLEAADPRRDLLLVEGDLLLADELLPRLAAGPANAALVDRWGTAMDGSVVRLDGEGLICEMVVPEDQGEAFDGRGVYKTVNAYRFSAEFWSDRLLPAVRSLVAQGRTDEYYERAFAELPAVDRCIVAVHTGASRWAEIDDPNDLANARFAFDPASRAATLDCAQGGYWGLPHQDHALLRNVHFPPPVMMSALCRALPDLLASYGSSQTVLDEKLSWVLRCSPASVVTLSGASQAFPMLRDHFAGRSIAIPAPTFGEYGRMFPRATCYADAPGQPLVLDPVLLDSHDVVVVVTPNNPTGTTVASGDLLALAEAHPATLLLVDESFAPFEEGPSLLEASGGILPHNVLVLTSLSKALGVPGARLGYLAAGDPDRLSQLRAMLPIWNLGALAEHVLELLLKFSSELEASFAQTRRDRAVLADRLAVTPGVLEVTVGGGNFLLARLDGAAGVAATARRRLLEEHAISLKDVTAKFADGAPRLRIGVRTESENAALVAALEQILGALDG